MAPPTKNNNKGKAHNKRVFLDIPGSYTIHWPYFSTRDENISSLVQKYGQWIVYDPGISRNTILLWTLPLLLFLIGGAIIGKRILKKI